MIFFQKVLVFESKRACGLIEQVKNDIVIQTLFKPVLQQTGNVSSVSAVGVVAFEQCVVGVLFAKVALEVFLVLGRRVFEFLGFEFGVGPELEGFKVFKEEYVRGEGTEDVDKFVVFEVFEHFSFALADEALLL